MFSEDTDQSIIASFLQTLFIFKPFLYVYGLRCYVPEHVHGCSECVRVSLFHICENKDQSVTQR